MLKNCVLLTAKDQRLHGSSPYSLPVTWCQITMVDSLPHWNLIGVQDSLLAESAQPLESHQRLLLGSERERDVGRIDEQHSLADLSDAVFAIIEVTVRWLQ